MKRLKTIEDIEGDFLQACEDGGFEAIKFILKTKLCADSGWHMASVDSRKYIDLVNHGFILACSNNNLEVVKFLASSPHLNEHAEIHCNNDCGIRRACKYGHLEIVQYLLEYSSGYTVGCLDKMRIHEEAKISKKELIELAKARDLKNQLSDEVSFKNRIVIKKPIFI